MRNVLVLLVAVAGLLCLGVPARAETWSRREWTVEGVSRQALVHVPETARQKPSPVVFAFHGHGGNMTNASRMFPFATLWPEAVVVCMQGLNTPGRLTDPEGKKPGWQHRKGEQGDRDLKFFDAVLGSLRSELKVDDSRIYATGHSNGGGFTYLLWAERGDVFAAVAPSAAAAGELGSLKPKPVLHVAGEKDPLVKYEWQKATIHALVKLNGCGPSEAWDQDPNCSIYSSATGTPVVTAIHPGGHEFHRDAPRVMVKFFKQHTLKP